MPVCPLAPSANIEPSGRSRAGPISPGRCVHYARRKCDGSGIGRRCQVDRRITRCDPGCGGRKKSLSIRRAFHVYCEDATVR